MLRIVRLLSQAQVGSNTQATEQEVIKALEEILADIKQQRRDNDTPPKKSQGGSPKDGGKQQPGQQKLIDNLIELKLIRTMQTRVNGATECCRKLIAGEEVPAEKAELLESLLQFERRAGPHFPHHPQPRFGEKPMNRTTVTKRIAWLTTRLTAGGIAALLCGTVWAGTVKEQPEERGKESAMRPSTWMARLQPRSNRRSSSG